MPGKEDNGFDLGDLVDEAKDLVGDHSGDVKDGITEVADFLGDQLGADKQTMKTVKQTAKGLVDDIADDAKPKKRQPKAKKPRPA
jgi:hypothetical protein